MKQSTVYFCFANLAAFMLPRWKSQSRSPDLSVTLWGCFSFFFSSSSSFFFFLLFFFLFLFFTKLPSLLFSFQPRAVTDHTSLLVVAGIGRRCGTRSEPRAVPGEPAAPPNPEPGWKCSLTLGNAPHSSPCAGWSPWSGSVPRHRAPPCVPCACFHGTSSDAAPLPPPCCPHRCTSGRL